MREKFTYSFKVEELNELKIKMLNWLKPFSIFIYLDNNEYGHRPNRFELLIACGAKSRFHKIPNDINDWVFGHVTYNWKDEIIPKLSSRHPNKIGFENCCFFQPEIVIYIPFGTNKIHIESLSKNPKLILMDILNKNKQISSSLPIPQIKWQFNQSQAEYLAQIRKIKNHIVEGDCYELNYCIEAFSNPINLCPQFIFHLLNKTNPSPFAALYKNEDSYCICASPERFLFKEGAKILSQPIKGTIGKSFDQFENAILKKKLLTDEKEKAENVMIVDLVRNDLSKCCKVGSISVSELFGIYEFPQLFHLISTVSGTLLEDKTIDDLFKVTFPMGSMTGAPKRIVMELIEAYEKSYRGLYSGTIGYITPENNIDFNVVIRSLFYNAETQELAYLSGGAITFDSIPEKEWEEVKLKAKAMESIFN